MYAHQLPAAILLPSLLNVSLAGFQWAVPEPSEPEASRREPSEHEPSEPESMGSEAAGTSKRKLGAKEGRNGGGGGGGGGDGDSGVLLLPPFAGLLRPMGSAHIWLTGSAATGLHYDRGDNLLAVLAGETSALISRPRISP